MSFKKFLKILVQSLYGVVILYFFFCWIIIPLVVPRLIGLYVEKNHNFYAKVGSVSVNPVLWRFNIFGLHVQDGAGQEILGFERLSVDISFVSLLKKIYHIQGIHLKGLFIHAEMLKNGQVVLMDLVPTPFAPQQKKTGVAPLVVIDEIFIDDGRIEFNDHTVSPVFKTALSDIHMKIQNFSTTSDGMAMVTLRAILDDRGDIKGEAHFKPFAKPFDLDFNLTLEHGLLNPLSPYIGKYTGRGLRDGKMDFTATYHISADKLTAAHRIVIQRFTFGDKVESQDALNLPFSLAVALLEDQNGVINISLPVSGDMADPQFKYTHLIWQTTHNFFVKLVTKPFSVLGSFFGPQATTEELSTVRFLPGKAELSSSEEKKLMLLSQSLKDRPLLLLEIPGAYNLSGDWKAIKADSFLKEYTKLRKESTRSEYGVLQTIFQRHYGIRKLWNLSKQFKIKGGYDYEKLNYEIRRQLSEESFPDKTALNKLASARARVIFDAVLKEQLDPRRVRMEKTKEVSLDAGFVTVPLALTVFDQPHAAVQLDPENTVDQATVREEKI